MNDRVSVILKTIDLGDRSIIINGQMPFDALTELIIMNNYE